MKFAGGGAATEEAAHTGPAVFTLSIAGGKIRPKIVSSPLIARK